MSLRKELRVQRFLAMYLLALRLFSQMGILRLAQPLHGANHGGEMGGVDRLDHVGVEAGIERSLAVVRLAVAG